MKASRATWITFAAGFVASIMAAHFYAREDCAALLAKYPDLLCCGFENPSGRVLETSLLGAVFAALCSLTLTVPSHASAATWGVVAGLTTIALHTLMATVVVPLPQDLLLPSAVLLGCTSVLAAQAAWHRLRLGAGNA